MKDKRFLLFFGIIISLFITSFISSVSPFISTNTQSGCQIVPIVRGVIKQNLDFDFNFHVLNSSNGYPISSSVISCIFHLYNQTGDHSYSAQLLNDPFSEHLTTNEFVARVNGNNFSTNGNYAYEVQCNGTEIYGGCAEKGFFQVTPNGQEATVGSAVFYIGLLFILIVFLLITIYIFTSNENLLSRVGMIGFGYLLLTAITFIAWNMANDFLTSSPFIVDMFRILFFVFIIGTFPLLIGGFAWYLIMITKIKEIQRLMDKGFSEDEANRRIKYR